MMKVVQNIPKAYLGFTSKGNFVHVFCLFQQWNYILYYKIVCSCVLVYLVVWVKFLLNRLSIHLQIHRTVQRDPCELCLFLPAVTVYKSVVWCHIGTLTLVCLTPDSPGLTWFGCMLSPILYLIWGFQSLPPRSILNTFQTTRNLGLLFSNHIHTPYILSFIIFHPQYWCIRYFILALHLKPKILEP